MGGFLTIGVVGFQLAILISIPLAARGGRNSFYTALAGWIIFTLIGGIATAGLMFLQLFTIIFAANIGAGIVRNNESIQAEPTQEELDRARQREIDAHYRKKQIEYSFENIKLAIFALVIIFFIGIGLDWFTKNYEFRLADDVKNESDNSVQPNKSTFVPKHDKPSPDTASQPSTEHNPYVVYGNPVRPTIHTNSSPRDCLKEKNYADISKCAEKYH